MAVAAGLHADAEHVCDRPVHGVGAQVESLPLKVGEDCVVLELPSDMSEDSHNIMIGAAGKQSH